MCVKFDVEQELKCDEILLQFFILQMEKLNLQLLQLKEKKKN